MARFIYLLTFLSLVGCGKEFTSSPNSLAGMSDAGEAGEGPVAGSGGSSEGGATSKGGSGGLDSGGAGQGGQTPSVGGDSSGGSAGSPGNPSAGSAGAVMTAGTGGMAGAGMAGSPQQGECTPGDQRCSGTVSQTCGENGKWATTTNCPFVCGGKGVCGGSCVPGDQQCSGVNAQKCNDSGYWNTFQSCGIACNITDHVASCGGACQNGTHQCSGKVPQTCVSNEWTSRAQCSFVCSSGSCSGVCVPGTQKCGPQGGVQTCDAAGQWSNEGSACPFACTDGACTGVCQPNKSCTDDGNACTDDTCNATGTACLHPAKLNGSSCGSSSSSACDNPDSCQAGVCQPNPKPVNTACTNDGNACTSDLCDGAGACQHPAAPAATVCRAAGCQNGTVTAQATCGGQTSCPAAQTSSCFGSCDPGGLVCANPAPQKVDDVMPIAIDNDASYLYVSLVSSGFPQIVRYTKQNGTKQTLFQSNNTSEKILNLIVAGQYLYFSETFWNGGVNPTSGQVSRIAVNGANQAATYVASQTTFGFAKNSARVYWNDGVATTCGCSSVATHHVYSVDIGGLTVVPFALNFGGVELAPDLEVTDTDLYLWQMLPQAASPGFYKPFLTRYNLTTPTTNAGLVNSYYMKNGIPMDTKASVGMDTMPNLTKNGTSIFAHTDSDGDGHAVLSFGQANDSFKYLGAISSTNFPQDSNPPVSNFVADSTYVYLGDKRIAVGGGSFVYWTNHELMTSTLTLDDTSLYFGSWGYWNNLPYQNTPNVLTSTLMKAPKN